MIQLLGHLTGLVLHLHDHRRPSIVPTNNPDEMLEDSGVETKPLRELELNSPSLVHNIHVFSIFLKKKHVADARSYFIHRDESTSTWTYDSQTDSSPLQAAHTYEDTNNSSVLETHPAFV